MYHFNIRTLEYLNAISRYGSLRKAARMMNVDPATVSRMLSQLEEQIEVSVWERLQNGAKLTAAGAELLNFYRSTLANESAVYSRLHDMKAFYKQCKKARYFTHDSSYKTKTLRNY